jgi:hypothetical protein
MRRRPRTLLAAIAVASLTSTGALADPDELIPCTRLVIKPQSFRPDGYIRFPGAIKFLCKGAFAMPSPEAAPGILQLILKPDPPGLPAYYATFCGPLGDPPGSAGYECGGYSGSVVRSALLTPNRIRGWVRQSSTVLPIPNGNVQLEITARGTSAEKRYCAGFGTPPPLKNSEMVYRARGAGPPAGCSPSGAFLAGADTLL